MPSVACMVCFSKWLATTGHSSGDGVSWSLFTEWLLHTSVINCIYVLMIILDVSVANASFSNLLRLCAFFTHLPSLLVNYTSQLRLTMRPWAVNFVFTCGGGAGILQLSCLWLLHDLRWKVGNTSGRLDVSHWQEFWPPGPDVIRQWAWSAGRRPYVSIDWVFIVRNSAQFRRQIQ